MSDAETVPARYQPDPWIDSQVTRAGGRAGLRVPRIMLRDWLGLSAGQTVGIAPCDAASVWFGSRVPRFFAEKTLTGRSDGVPQVYLPKAVVDYLGAGVGDTVRFHKPDARPATRARHLAVDPRIGLIPGGHRLGVTHRRSPGANRNEHR